MKNYLIIGASSGIGEALTQKLLDQGHQVYGTYQKKLIEAHSPNANFYHLDVMEETPDLSFIPAELDGLVYCPGSINLKPFAKIKAADFKADFELQVVGAVKVMQAALKALKAGDGASVVFFSTVAVQMGFNFHTQVATSKGAIEGLTKSLAAELAPKVRVNCIAPSLTDTPLAAKLLSSEEKKQANAQRHPLRKIGQAADIANMAAFLLSEESTWMSGQILHVDGGMSTLRV